ncbi:MAG: uroporphyrinogen-III synthase [Gammaproteobacteria bacterium]|nr:uroporphyrinogen-III synthase [Gammaproteobacteria bacterium]
MMIDALNGTLAGRHIVVTRPAHQADNLCAQLEKAGAVVWRFPSLDITPLVDAAHIQAALQKLKPHDWLLFVSRNAVTLTATHLLQYLQTTERPRIIAVGAATAQCLQELGIALTFAPPAPYNSEALLAHELLQHVQHQQILIVRGQGGRELLRETLEQRGAHVSYLEVYRRDAADLPIALITQLSNALAQHTIDALIITSEASLHALIDALAIKDTPPVWQTRLVVISERLYTVARSLGFNGDIWIAQTASDEAIINCLQNGFHA